MVEKLLEFFKLHTTGCLIALACLFVACLAVFIIFNKQIMAIYRKHKEVILYVFFGGCTTVVSILSFWLFNSKLGWNATLSNIPATFLAVLFAYITNKIWVFESKTTGFKDWLREILSFFGARVITFFLEELIIFIFADRLKFNSMVVKVLGTIIVMILNYVFSKLFIFKNDDKKEKAKE